MVNKVIISLLLSCISAICYRAGGMSKDPGTEPKWIPTWMRQSWFRDWLIPMFSQITLLLWWHDAEWYMLLIPFVCTYALMGLAFSTYWDFVPFNKGKDNFYMHGFFVGIATFPYIFFGYAWWAVLLQAVISGLAMGLWCKVNDNDVVEEFGRGFIATIVRTIHG